MRIRRADLEDALAIATVHVRSWKTAYPGLIPQSFLDSLTPEARLDVWRNTLGAPPAVGTGTLVLVEEARSPGAHSPEGAERIVGFTSFCPVDDVPHEHTAGEVMTLYLDPDAWGRGGGELLLAAATDVFRGAGIRTATLWVLETNARARRFYERLGWRPDGASKLHDWKAFVATDVRYRLDLDVAANSTGGTRRDS